MRLGTGYYHLAMILRDCKMIKYSHHNRLSFVRRATLLVLIQVVWSMLLSAQVKVSGQVTDATNDQVMAGVEVLLLPQGSIYFTSADGQFNIPKLRPGSYELVVYQFGYGTEQWAFTVSDQAIEHPFTLTPLSTGLETVTVIDEREGDYASTRLRAVEGTAIYAGKKNEVVLLEQLTFNVAANNPRQLYSQVSGLNIYETNDAGLQLNIGGRGLDPNRSASFNTRQNGYDISADVLGYPESYYTPPAEALSRIEVIRGAASLQYGTQFGGLVNFVFKAPEEERLVLESRQSLGSFGLFTSFNSLSGTLGRLSYRAHYNYKEGNGFRPNAGFESHHAFVHVGYQLSPRTRLTAELTYLQYLAQQAGGLTDAQFYQDPLFSNRARNWFQVNWHLAALRLEHQLSSRTELSLQLFGLDAQRDAVGFRTNRVSQLDDLTAPRDLLVGTFQNVGAEGRFLHRYPIRGRQAVGLVGFKWYKSDNTAIQGPGSTNMNADFRLMDDLFPDYSAQSDFRFPNLNLALFGENIFYLTDRLTLTPGIRFEHIDTRSEGSFQRINFDLAGNPILRDTMEDNRTLRRSFVLLGLGSSYRPNDKIELYANVSQNYRSVTFSDIRVINPSFQVDPNISDEQGGTADAGLRGRTDKWSFDFSAFALLYDNRLGEVLKAEERINSEGMPIPTGRVIRFRTNVGRALLYGLESVVERQLLGINKAQNAWKLNVFANLALTRSRYIASEIPSIEGRQVEFIPMINLKTGLRLRRAGFSTQVQYTYLSEQFTDATNAPQIRNDNQNGISGAIPSYGIADISMSYQWHQWRLETGLNNALNNSYFTRRATGYPGPGIIPSAPRSFYCTLAYRFSTTAP